MINMFKLGLNSNVLHSYRIRTHAEATEPALTLQPPMWSRLTRR